MAPIEIAGLCRLIVSNCNFLFGETFDVITRFIEDENLWAVSVLRSREGTTIVPYTVYAPEPETALSGLHVLTAEAVQERAGADLGEGTFNSRPVTQSIPTVRRIYETSESDNDRRAAESDSDDGDDAGGRPGKIRRVPAMRDVSDRAEPCDPPSYRGLFSSAQLQSSSVPPLAIQPAVNSHRILPGCDMLFCTDWEGYATFRSVESYCTMNKQSMEQVAMELLLKRGPEYIPEQPDNKPELFVKEADMSIAVQKVIVDGDEYEIDGASSETDLSAMFDEAPEFMRVIVKAVGSPRPATPTGEGTGALGRPLFRGLFG